eukprot:g715.t1
MSNEGISEDHKYHRRLQARRLCEYHEKISNDAITVDTETSQSIAENDANNNANVPKDVKADETSQEEEEEEESNERQEHLERKMEEPENQQNVDPITKETEIENRVVDHDGTKSIGSTRPKMIRSARTEGEIEDDHDIDNLRENDTGPNLLDIKGEKDGILGTVLVHSAFDAVGIDYTESDRIESKVSSQRRLRESKLMDEPSDTDQHPDGLDQDDLDHRDLMNDMINKFSTDTEDDDNGQSSEEEMTSLSTRYNSLRATSLRWRRSLAMEQRQRRILAKRYESTQDQYDELHEAHELLQSKYEAKETLIQELYNSLQDKRRESRESRQKVRDLLGTNALMQQRIAQNDMEIQAHDLLRSELKKEMDLLKKTNRSLRSQSSRLKQELHQEREITQRERDREIEGRERRTEKSRRRHNRGEIIAETLLDELSSRDRSRESSTSASSDSNREYLTRSFSNLLKSDDRIDLKLCDDVSSLLLVLAQSCSKVKNELQTIEQKRLSAKLKSQQELNICVICQDAPKAVVFQPCNHLCSCVECANRLQKCPICRKKIRDRIHVYNS